GLTLLLDAWERLNPANAELHLWPSLESRLENRQYQHIYNRAQLVRCVSYHAVSPDPENRAALRATHFLLYPYLSTNPSFPAVIMEAMAAGCRIIAPAFGALPEMTGGYARLYPPNANEQDYAAILAENLAAELVAPWTGAPDLSIAQQRYCAAV